MFKYKKLILKISLL